MGVGYFIDLASAVSSLPTPQSSLPFLDSARLRSLGLACWYLGVCMSRQARARVGLRSLRGCSLLTSPCTAFGRGLHIHLPLILDAVMQTPTPNPGNSHLTKAQPDWKIARNEAAQESARSANVLPNTSPACAY